MKLDAFPRRASRRAASVPVWVALLIGSLVPAHAGRGAISGLDRASNAAAATAELSEVAEANPGPHWCNATADLVEDIYRLGGESVMRVELGGGRTLERYWNVNEEVTIEHGADGNSCLVELRNR